jgi:hypothetical protein
MQIRQRFFDLLRIHVNANVRHILPLITINYGKVLCGILADERLE